MDSDTATVYVVFLTCKVDIITLSFHNLIVLFQPIGNSRHKYLHQTFRPTCL